MNDTGGWFKASRTRDALELLRANPNALILAYVIAFRARYRHGFHADGLALGEALLGDHDGYGMSEQNYRTAKCQLSKWHFATFRATNKGTVGKLVDTRLFSFNPLDANDQTNGRVTDSQRTGNGRLTTNIEHRTVERQREGERDVELPSGFPASPDDAKLAAAFVGCPEEFAITTWNKAMSRGGMDAKGQPIRSWSHYLATEFRFEQNRQSARRRPQRPTSAPPDHSAGF